MNDLVDELYFELRYAANFGEDKSKQELKDLPMRVVVTVVLPFFELSMKKEKIGEFDLFGTFLRDKTRKVFFIFTSLYISSYVHQSCVIDFGRLRSLSWKLPPRQFLSKIILNSANFRNLESLSFCDIRSDMENNIVGKDSRMANLFSVSEGFPSLVKFSLNQDELHRTGEIDVSSWCSNNPKLWRKQMRSLSITSSRDERPSFPLFFANFLGEVDTLSEIVTLDLRFVILSKLHRKIMNLEGGKVVLRIPNVRRVTLVNCSGFEIEPGSQIKYLCLGNMEVDMTKYLYSLSPNLVELEIDGGGSTESCTSSSWLFDDNNHYSHVSELTSLRSLTLENLNWVNSDDDDDIFDLTESVLEEMRDSIKPPENLNFYLNENLEVLEVRDISNFPVNILTGKKNPLKLKEIVLNTSSSELPFSPIFPFSNHLTRMELIEVYSITDVFFQRNKWENLEVFALYCDDFSYVSGSRWEKMPKLKSICLSNCKWMTDKFFEDMQFTNLEVLSIGICNGFKGASGWGYFSNLKEIRVTNCRNINDEVFQSCDFGASLETLVILGLPEINGVGWSSKMARKLVKFEILFCVKFQDLFLVENEFENLRDIKIVDCGCVKGLNWGKMKQLRKVTAREYFLKILKCNEDVVKNETKLKAFYI